MARKSRSSSQSQTAAPAPQSARKSEAGSASKKSTPVDNRQGLNPQDFAEEAPEEVLRRNRFNTLMRLDKNERECTMIMAQEETNRLLQLLVEGVKA